MARTLFAIILIYALPFTTAAQIFTPVQQIDLLFGGDIMQHETQLNMARQRDGKYSFSYCFRHISDLVKSADISIVNLETTIGKSDYSGYPSFCAPDSFLYAIKEAGFNTLLFANNHCMDKGKRGALHTLDMLDSLNFAHCGVYRNAKEREERYPLIIEKKGIRIAVLNYTYSTNGREIPAPIIVNLIDKETIARDIQSAKEKRADAIIVCMHWGDEYVSLPSREIKELSNWLIEQGVNHIIGNHPHVVQPLEIRESESTPDRHVVAYSTGNLVSNMSLRRTDGGIMIGMRLCKILNYTRPVGVRYLLTWIAPKRNDGKRDFTIYPAATTRITNWDYAEQKRRLFIDDSRSLFNKHNKGEITEMFIDSVVIVR
ncbi:MAG: CapA family protein [Bacteroidaceae bacterium]|nr:CapA family protein [Bacteroidaceae bacterium]